MRIKTWLTGRIKGNPFNNNDEQWILNTIIKDYTSLIWCMCVHTCIYMICVLIVSKMYMCSKTYTWHACTFHIRGVQEIAAKILRHIEVCLNSCLHMTICI
jgi:hypothetical protein